jgi:hypothetical protein
MNDEPLYSSTRDEDRPIRGEFRMTEPEKIDMVIKRPPREASAVAPSMADKPQRMMLDKKRLAKSFDKRTSATIVTNLRDGTPLPPSVAKKLVDKKIVVAKDSEASEKIDDKTTGRKLVLKKEDIFDRLTNVVMKTFNIK